MSQKTNIKLQETWLDIDSMNWKDNVTSDQVLEFTTARPIDLKVELVISVDELPKKIDLKKHATVERFRKSWNDTVSTYLSKIVVQAHQSAEGSTKAFDKAEKHLSALNRFIEKSFAEFRQTLRMALIDYIEKESDDKNTKVEQSDILSVGSSNFKSISFVPGIFQEADGIDEPDSIDLTDAIKYRKWQYCVVAWAGNNAVVNIRKKRPFKQRDVNEMRFLLPVGAKGSLGLFRTCSGTAAEFILKESKHPKEYVLKEALKEQCNKSFKVTISVGEMEIPDEAEED